MWGNGLRLVQAAARRRAKVVLPSPGLPCTMVTFPKGIYGSHSHSTVCVSTSLMRIISTVSSCGGSFNP
ncbi:hypothetical protein EVA_08746 [gut metagenome]|uniref:Uncharacterized protein n=1 Tax=gut metagenome TaxID=749906 RepID=J9GSE8_9ZZZZ